MHRNASSHDLDPTCSSAFDSTTTGRVLIVDGVSRSRRSLRTLLAKSFDVLTAASGERAIELCTGYPPDLVVIDAALQGGESYETCRRLKAFLTVPVIFLADASTFESQLDAFDAGGDGLIPKPISPTIFPRKLALAIQQHHAHKTLWEEKRALERMAMGFLASGSQTGTMLEFMRSGVSAPNYEVLAENLVTSIKHLGLQSCVLIRHPNEDTTVVSAHGAPTSLEISMLNNVRGMGRLFQFKRHIVVNYDRVSIIVSNMPDEKTEEDRAGALRDSLTILAESTEVMTTNVDLRLEGQKRAEQLQIALSEAELALNALGDQTRMTLRDTRLLLQEMIDGIEKTYAWLDISQHQETEISATMDSSVQRILSRLTSGGRFDEKFAQVLQALNAGRGAGADVVELF